MRECKDCGALAQVVLKQVKVSKPVCVNCIVRPKKTTRNRAPRHKVHIGCGGHMALSVSPESGLYQLFCTGCENTYVGFNEDKQKMPVSTQ